MRTRHKLLALTLTLLPLAGCGGAQTILYADGPAASGIAWMTWVVLIGSCAITVFMWALIFLGMLKRRGSFDSHEPVHIGGGQSWLAIGGFAFPVTVLFACFVLSLNGMAEFPMHGDSSAHPSMQSPDIRVIGHQWWWEVRYTGGPVDQQFTTANEIHIPVGVPVNLAIETADVLHSFWVPKLQGKVDMVPGYVNNMRLQADYEGTYRGQCAQYCGAQHAHMVIIVVAQKPADYQAWRAHMVQDAREPATPDEMRGRQVFLAAPCGNCHTVRGTPAGGVVAPDLTHIAARRGLASNTLPNDFADLEAWVTHAQSLKPEVEMPDMTQFSGADLRAMTAYLMSLK